MISQNIHGCPPVLQAGFFSQVFIHYLSVRILDQGLTISEILKIFNEATGLAPAVYMQLDARILATYRAQTGRMMTNGGSYVIQLTGDKGWLVVLTGSDSLKINRWAQIVDAISNFKKATISRLDLAIDIEEGLDLYDVIKGHESGEFTNGSIKPVMLPIGNFIKDDERARTVNVGKRENGRCFRAYEIGRKSGAGIETIRLEVELHGNKQNVIQLGSLTAPTPLFCGAYPFLNKFGNGEIETVSTNGRIKSNDLNKLIEIAKNSYGKLINLLSEIGLSDLEIVELIRRSGCPKGLSPEDFINKLPHSISQKITAINASKKNIKVVVAVTKVDQKLGPGDYARKRREKDLIQPLVIRLRDAPGYLGMDKNRFNEEVRPNLIDIDIGKHGVAFYRVDLERWMDDHVNRTGRSKSKNGVLAWDKHQQEPKAFTSKVADIEPLAKKLKEKEFLPDLAKLAKTKQKNGCTTPLNLKSENPSVKRALASCLASVQRGT